MVIPSVHIPSLGGCYAGHRVVSWKGTPITALADLPLTSGRTLPQTPSHHTVVPGQADVDGQL